MTVRPKVLLVAVGGYGRVYLDYLTQHDTGADIAGICDVMPDIQEKLPVIQEQQIPVYQSLEAFYQEHEADLAVIASPMHFHTEMTLTCLSHGTNVLCEKPLCLTLTEAEQMQQAADNAGKFLAVGYQLDYQRDVLAVKQDIISGRYGTPIRARAVHGFRRGEKYYARNNWAGHKTVNGREVLDSPFSNASAHNFQLLTFLMGQEMASACDVVDLKAELYRANPHVENFDTAALRFRMENGAEILYYTTHALPSPEFGPYGVMEFTGGRIIYGGQLKGFRGELADGTVIDYSQVNPGEPLQKLLDALECVKHGGTPVCGVAAERPHIHAVRLAAEMPICSIAPEKITVDHQADDTFRYIDDIENIFMRCAQAWKLPGELGIQLG